MKVLIISNTLPFPPDTGEKSRIFNLLKRMSPKDEISLISFVRSPDENRYVSELKKYCKEVETVPMGRRPKIKHIPKVIWWILSGVPLDAGFAVYPEMEEKIARRIKIDRPDIIQIEHSFMAGYSGAISGYRRGKKVLVFHNLGFVQYERMLRAEGRIYRKVRSLFNWIPAVRWEKARAREFDKSITMSEHDRGMLWNTDTSLNISVVPNGVDTERYVPMAAPKNPDSLLFIGDMGYGPNEEGVLYFYDKVFPLIKKEIQDIMFHIVGGNVPESVMELKQDRNVKITGYVKDVRPFYEKTAVIVAPLLTGSGTRIKILESMAFGRPVVSTSVGCEGISAEHGSEIYISDDPTDFAGYTIGLIKNKHKWDIITKKARALVEEEYSWTRSAEEMRNIYKDMYADAVSRRRTGARS